MNTIELVRDIRREYPEAKAADIAREIGVTRQRVSQILSELGLPTRTKLSRPGYLYRRDMVRRRLKKPREYRT
jgi:hypothetical protein